MADKTQLNSEHKMQSTGLYVQCNSSLTANNHNDSVVKNTRRIFTIAHVKSLKASMHSLCQFSTIIEQIYSKISVTFSAQWAEDANYDILITTIARTLPCTTDENKQKHLQMKNSCSTVDVLCCSKINQLYDNYYNSDTQICSQISDQ